MGGKLAGEKNLNITKGRKTLDVGKEEKRAIRARKRTHLLPLVKKRKTDMKERNSGVK